PFLTVSFTPLFYPEDTIPRPICPWPPRTSLPGLRRNPTANRTLRSKRLSNLKDLKTARLSWFRNESSDIGASFSKVAIIVQMPKEFEFRLIGRPAQVFYAGPFTDASTRRPIRFPWVAARPSPKILSPWRAIAVHFAPQLEVIARSDAVVCHAGL